MIADKEHDLKKEKISAHNINSKKTPTRRAAERGEAKELLKRKNILRLNKEFQNHAKLNQWSWPSRKERGYSYRQNPYDFIREVYREWIGKMTLSDLKAVDEPLWWAVHKSKESMPDDVYLPTEAEAELNDIEDPRARAIVEEAREMNRTRMKLLRTL